MFRVFKREFDYNVFFCIVEYGCLGDRIYIICKFFILKVIFSYYGKLRFVLNIYFNLLDFLNLVFYR